MNAPPVLTELELSSEMKQAVDTAFGTMKPIVLAYVDTAGVGRVKTVPTAQLASAAAWGVGMSPVFDTFLADDRSVTTDVLGSPEFRSGNYSTSTLTDLEGRLPSLVSA